MITTATRRAALCCALLASTCLAAPAFAQSAPPSIYKNVDDNGVDLTDGSFNLSIVEGSIGAGKGALALVRSWGAGGERDNMTVRFNRRVSGATATITLEFGNAREEFVGPASASSFASAQGSGAVLAKLNAGEYRLTAADGSTTDFATPQGLTEAPNSPWCRIGAEAPCILLASHTARPDGLVMGYQWDTGENCLPNGQCAQFERLRSVTNNLGYGVTFSFVQEQNPTSGLPGPDWKKRNGATLANYVVASPGRSVSLTSSTPGVTEITDDGGRKWRVTRDLAGRVAGVRRPSLSAGDPDDITVSYDGPASLVVSQIVRDGVTTTYTRSVSGATGTMTRTNVVNGASQTTTVVSDLTIGRPTLVTDPLGHETRFSYDSNGRLKRTTAHEGNYVEVDYDGRGNVRKTDVVAKGGAGAITTSATYPESCANVRTCNQPDSITDARGNRTDFTYDPVHGGVKTVTGPAVTVNGVTRQPQARFGYTQVGGVHELTATSVCRTQASCADGADEVRTTLTYGANNLPVSSTSGAGDGSLAATTVIVYDPHGNLASVDGPLLGTADTTRYRYNQARELVGVIGPDPDGPASGSAGLLKPRATRTTIDGRGLVTRQEQGNVPEFNGADPAAIDAAWAAFSPAQALETGYDAYDRPETARLIAGGTVYSLTQTSYDARGRPDCTAVRMNRGRFGLAQPDACTLDLPAAYGELDHLSPDRIGKTLYDAAGRVTQLRVAVGTADEAAEVTTGYTANGQVETVTDGEGNLTTYEYDGFDRLKKTLYPVAGKGANTSNPNDFEELGCDPNGNVTSFRNRADQTIAFTHDALNRVTLKTLPNSEPAVTYSYDLLGNLTSASQPGHALAFSYDALGRQLSEAGAQGTVASQYDLAGRRTRLTYPDYFFVTYDHLVTGDVTAIRENGAASGPGVLATYRYDDQGRRDLLTRGNGATTSYTHDPVSRLSELTHAMVGGVGNVTIGLAYNPAGQIVTRTASNDAYAWTGHGSGGTAYTNNGLNQLTQRDATAITHDAKGNLTNDGRGRTPGYSSENLLTSNGTAQFGYDPLLRFARNGATSGFHQNYLYDPVQDVIITTAASTGSSLRFVHGPGKDEPLVLYNNGVREYWHADERGSVIARSKSDGTLRRIVTYDEYGRPGAQFDSFMYTGAPYVLGGTYLMRNRFYGFDDGRFWQPDPIGYGDGPNRYAYVGGDPVNFTDPLGLEAKGKDECTTAAECEQDIDAAIDKWYPGASPELRAHLHSIANASMRGVISLNQAKSDVRAALSGAGTSIYVVGNRIVDRTASFLGTDSRTLRELGRQAFDYVVQGGATAAHAPAPSPCGCLEAGTPVATPSGLTSIEQIKVGDLVMAVNEQTGEIAAKPVTDLIRPEPKPLFRLALTDVGGEAETFHATDDHPWKVEGKGWVETVDLKPGDRINTGSGADMVVTALTLTERIEPTYNLTVADWHTFMVGEDRAVVHNANCYKHNFRYHPRVRSRGVQDPRGHNFPYSMDDVILRQRPVEVSSNYHLYRLPNQMGKSNGYFEIGLNPNTGVIVHRTFRKR